MFFVSTFVSAVSVCPDSQLEGFYMPRREDIEILIKCFLTGSCLRSGNDNVSSFTQLTSAPTPAPATQIFPV